jgi:hypothetical protein
MIIASQEIELGGDHTSAQSLNILVAEPIVSAPAECAQVKDKEVQAYTFAQASFCNIAMTPALIAQCLFRDA